MKKLLTLCLALLMLLGLCSGALAASRPVIDRADLFTPEQETRLENLIEDFRTKYGMDFVVVTSNENHGSTQQTVADELYDRGGYGLGEKKSGVLYYIDMYERVPYLSTAGDMIDYMTDERIEEAHDSCWQLLSAGHYWDAAVNMVHAVGFYVQKGIPEGQYQYDIITGERLTASHKVLTVGEVVVCALIGLVAALLFVKSVQGRYNLKGNTYEYAMRENCQVTLTDKEDQYLHSTTTRTRKVKQPPAGGSGGGFSHSGGSGVHHSSSGASHGGGAGKRF